MADHRFGIHEQDGVQVHQVEPLGYDLTRDRMGATVLPGLSDLQNSLRDALGQPDFRVSLGRSRARIQQTRIEMPLSLDLGVTDWLSVGATVPFVKRRAEVGFTLQADSMTADLGAAPASSDSQLFLGQLSSAVQAMEAHVASVCADAATGSDCVEAQAALADGQNLRDALQRAYQAALFPFSGSSTAGELRARLGSLQSRFAAAGVETVPDPASLPLADGPLDATAFQDVLQEPGYGIQGDSLATWESRWELGDVELHGAVRLLEREPPPDTVGFFGGVSYLVGVGGLVRLATGTPPNPDNFVDTGSGDGQMDVEGRVFADVGFARRAGVWADVRYGVQRPGEVVRRIAPPDAVLPPLASRGTVTWNPGDYLQLEVAPRWRLTPELAAALRYRYFRKGRDRYSLAPGASSPTGGSLPDPAVLDLETKETLHEAGISLVYSTLAAQRAGRTGLPMEARFRYRRALAGDGGRTWKEGRMEAGVRLFWRIWGD